MRRSVPVFVLCAVLALTATAAAAPQPDLRVRAVSTATSQEAPGSLLTASVTVLNAGDRTARASRVGLYLSRDRRRTRGDFRLRPRPRLGARRPRSRARLLRTFRVPAGVPAGSYVLIACADDTRRVRERRERNNCRSTRRRIRIAALDLPGSPVLQVSGPTNGSFTFDSTPTYFGAAQASRGVIARVEAGLDGGVPGTSGVVCTGCGTASAVWAFTPAFPLADGPHGFQFRAIDGGGGSSPVITRTLIVDTAAPAFVSIAAAPSSTAVTATFSEPLVCSTVNASDFSAEINGSPVVVSNAGCSASGAVVSLTLGSAPAAGGVVAITLSGVVSDRAGNVAPRPTTRMDAA